MDYNEDRQIKFDREFVREDDNDGLVTRIDKSIREGFKKKKKKKKGEISPQGGGALKILKIFPTFFYLFLNMV